MVVPFGSLVNGAPGRTYRPTMTPEESTPVDTALTGTTSSFARTACRKLTAVALGRQRLFAVVGHTVRR